MNKRVLVFGSYVTDLCGRTNGFPAVGETIKGHYFKLGPGGKGSNQAVAAHRAGAYVTFITKLGRDALGKQALDFYKSENISTEHIIIDDEEQTGAALIIVDEATSQNQIVVIGGACENFTDEDMPKILTQVEKSDIVLTQLETNMQPIRMVLKHAKKHGLMTVLNPAPAQPIDDEVYRAIDIITPNETEAEILTGVQVRDASDARTAARVLLEKGVGGVVITLGESGVFAFDGKEERIIDAIAPFPVVDTTGAGDAFSGGLTTAISKGMEFFDAVAFGVATAGLSVTKYGTAPAMPYSEEIEEVLKATNNL